MEMEIVITSVKSMRGYKDFSTLVAVYSLRPNRSWVDVNGSNDSESNVRGQYELTDLLEI